MTSDETTLARLALLAQRGDQAAYAAMLASCRIWLLRYYRRRVSADNIDDIVQETLLSIHRKLGSYDTARPVIPWLAAIARYRFIDYLRTAYRIAADSLPEEDIVGADGEEDALIARLSLDRLFEGLPPAQCRAIELVKLKGLSISEASASTGQSESLVKVNIHRGLKRLAALIEGA